MTPIPATPPVLLTTTRAAPSPTEPPPWSLPSGSGFEIPLLTVLGLGLLLGTCRRLIPNCRPDQILVIAGRAHRRGDGQSVGYRVVHGGRSLVLPWLERCSWMDVRTQPVPIQVVKAYALGGTPIDVEAIATVKISTDRDCVGNAIERFLEHDSAAMQEVAVRTLEGHLRVMVAGLTPEQVNEDRLRFADKVLEITRPDITKIGLQIDTFKILRVSDGVDYLDSLGRARLAEVLRDAAKAEAEGFGDADKREARAEERAEVAATTARTVVEERGNGLRTVRARLDQQVRSAEERVDAVAEEARARAEKALQALRSELERLRLEADVVLPARAREQAEEWRCRGAAAATIEDALASAAINDQLAALWRAAGDQAGSIFLLQQLETVLGEAAALAGQLQLGRITALETGNPVALANLAGLHPAVMRNFFDQVRDIVGIDVLQALNPHRPSRP
jgi:flotillin